MERDKASAAAKLVADISKFGGQVSHVMHNFVSLQDSVHDNLSEFLGSLDAAIQVLNQVDGLLKQQALLPCGSGADKSALFSADGIDYTISLAEECSVAICRAKSVVEGNVSRGRYDSSEPETWESLTSRNEQGQLVFTVPVFDEAEFFRQLKELSWKKRNISRAISDAYERLDKVQLLLLLVAQVVTVRGLTTELPSGEVDLKSIVDYYCQSNLILIFTTQQSSEVGSSQESSLGSFSNLPPPSKLNSCLEGELTLNVVEARIERAACLVDLTRPSLTSGRYRSRSSSLSYSSDSDSDVGGQRRRRRRGRGPPPPPPPPPPPNYGPPRPAPPAFGPSPGIRPLEGVQVIDINCGVTKDAQPPSYTENNRPSGSISVVPAEKPDQISTPVVSASKSSETTFPPDPELISIKVEEKSKDDEVTKAGGSVANESPRLLKSPISLRTKVKSFFRSKSSLEAEMKMTLAADNASLEAFIIQEGEHFKVPHSAFHSLEYTHIRTILSQLQDDTWFKTFSDLREIEHDALIDILNKKFIKGKWLSRELVVLKVLQQNKLNAWARVLQSCMKLEEFLPQHMNARIILAIVRHKENDPTVDDNIIMPDRKLTSNLYDNPSKASVNSGSCHGEVIDIAVPPPQPSGLRPRPGPPRDATGPLLGGPHPTAWSGPGGPPPPPGAGYGGFMSCQRADVTPKTPLNDVTALEALTSYKAYTFRPVAPHTSATVSGAPAAPTWTRCFVTLEHDTKEVIQERIASFHRRGDSVIDLKLQLTEPQSAQISRLIDELNRLEIDFRFEHKIVELSMVDRERGLVKRQTKNLNVDVIHTVLQRSPKEHLSPMTVYNQLHGPPRMMGGPPPPPPPPPFVKLQPRKLNPVYRNRRRRSLSVSSYWSSASSSSGDTDSLFGSDSNSDSDDEERKRWKKDPVKFKFTKEDKEKDIVQLLLARWTPAVDTERIVMKDETTGEEKRRQKKERKERRSRRVYDSDSLADD